MAGLKKELNLWKATIYGIGIILGAGIYAIIGEGAAVAGNSIWLSFVLAAVIAAFTGLSYAELSSRYPHAAAEYHYTRHAFRREGLSFVVAFVLVVAGIIAGATVALGFAGYFSFLFGTDRLLTAMVLVVLLSLISFKGMKESTILTIISTAAEVGGLLLVIVLGLPFIGNATTNYFSSPAGLTSILGGISLIFFAYIGFEDVANISEDTKNAAKVVPKALLISIAVTTVLYILVSVAAVSVIGADGLAASKAPLASVVSAAYNESLVGLMSIIALFATGNTVLIILIVVSRILFGLARQGVMPRVFGKIHRRTRTPHIAVFAVMAVALAALLLGNIRTIASLTDIGIFIAYLAVNLSLIRVRFRDKTRPAFRSPVNVGRFPVLALLGAASSAVMLTVFPLHIVLMEAGVIVAGYVVYRGMKAERLIR